MSPLRYPLDSCVKKKKDAGRGKTETASERLRQHHRNKRKEFARTLQSTSMCGAGSIGTIYSKIFETENFFKTYNDAYEALMEYNKNPYDLDADITVAQLYELWTDEYFERIAPSATRSITSAWAYCSDVYKMRVKDVRVRHIKGCMEDGFRIEERGEKIREKRSTLQPGQRRESSPCSILCLTMP